MTVWPNWVDLLIVTIISITCYRGFGRGFLGELFNLAGAISATVLTLNYSSLVTKWLRRWVLWFNPTITAFIVFWAVFLILMVAVHMVVRRVAHLVKWEPLHWFTQAIGLTLGGLRGVWWSGFLALALSLSGFIYAQQSVEERSVLGPPLLRMYRPRLEQIADRFPGKGFRGNTLMPPAKATPRPQ